MGGTSTDVCLVRGGTYGMTTEGRVGQFPIQQSLQLRNGLAIGPTLGQTVGQARRQGGQGLPDRSAGKASLDVSGVGHDEGPYSMRRAVKAQFV